MSDILLEFNFCLKWKWQTIHWLSEFPLTKNMRTNSVFYMWNRLFLWQLVNIIASNIKDIDVSERESKYPGQNPRLESILTINSTFNIPTHLRFLTNYPIKTPLGLIKEWISYGLHHWYITINYTPSKLYCLRQWNRKEKHANLYYCFPINQILHWHSKQSPFRWAFHYILAWL